MTNWRIVGAALMAGVALFLVSILIKLLLVGMAAFLVVRVVGGLVAGRFAGRLGRGGWQSAGIISINNPAYRTPMNRTSYDRIIPIN